MQDLKAELVRGLWYVALLGADVRPGRMVHKTLLGEPVLIGRGSDGRVFALRDIDLTKIESRPIRGRPWEYLFYVDLPVGRNDLKCARALVHLAEFARSMRTLGSYPSWKSREAAATRA